MPGPNTPDNSQDIPEDSPADSPFAHSHAQHANEPAATAPTDPARAPDPGSRTTMLLAIFAALALFVTTAVLQNRSPDEAEVAPSPSESSEVADTSTADAPAFAPPSLDQFTLVAKVGLKARWLLRMDPNTIPTLDSYAFSEADQLRMVVFVAEYANLGQARERIQSLRETFEPGSAARDDLDLLARLYAPLDDTPVGGVATDELVGTADQPVAGASALTEDGRQRLIEHHGYFGEVALTAGLPDDHPERLDLLGGGVLAIVFMTAAGLVMGLAFLSGCVLLVVGIFMRTMGRLQPKMPVPQRGGSVYIETFAIFVGGFLLIKLVSELFNLTTLSMLLQWSLILTVFWPLLRGMSLVRWKGTVGLHRGNGVMREIGCGFLAYLAGLPLFVAAALLVAVLQLLVQGRADEAGPPPSNPLFETIASAPWWALVLLLSLATIWAPLVEEIIFRGGLFRTARSYTPFAVAAVGVGIVFAFMHNYGPLFTPPLIALAVVFAFMREWRGSLIAPIFAHFLHNATVMTLLLTMVNVLDL